MTSAHEIVSRPTWAETPDGEIIPSYTGSNAPKYPGIDEEANREALEEMHPQAPQTSDLAVIIEGVRHQAGLRLSSSKESRISPVNGLSPRVAAKFWKSHGY